MSVKMQELAQRHILVVAKLLLTRYRPLTIDCVNCITTMLMLISDQHALVYWNHRWVTLDVLNLDLTPSTDINTVLVRFYGGPPGKRRYYDGSLMSFVLDRIATHIVVHGYEATREKLRVS